MSEPGTQTNRSTTSVHGRCTKCRTKLPKGQSDALCTSCTSEPSLSEQASTSQVLTTPATDPEWVRSLSSMMADLSTASKASLDLLSRLVLQVSPARSSTDTSRGRTSIKRPRSEQRSLSPVSSVSPSPLPGLMIEGDTRSEGEWSDPEQDWDPELSPKSAAMVNSLVTAVRDTFQIQDEPPPSTSQGVSFFPSRNVEKVFPPHEDLTLVLTKAWSRPDRRFVHTKRLNQLYPFPADDVAKWSTVPKVDPSIARLTKHTTIPVADGAVFRDPADRRAEFFSRSAFEAGGSALRPIFASAWVAKAMSEWSLRLHQDIGLGASPADLQTIVMQMAQAASYLCDASLDAGALVAQTTALVVAIRRALWLKVWFADSASKRSLTSIPFSGLRLFGTKLDEIISDATGGKSSHLPQNRPKRPFIPRESSSRFQSFRRFPSARFPSSSGSKPSAANHGKKPSFKPKPSWRPRTQSSRSTSSRQTSA